MACATGVIYSDLDWLRICAIVQTNTANGPYGYRKITDQATADELNMQDKFNQQFAIGDRAASVWAEHSTELKRRGMAGEYVVKDGPITKPQLIGPPRRSRFTQFTDALRRVFHLGRHNEA